MPLSPSRRALVGVIVFGAMVTMGLVVSPSTVTGTLESLSADPLLFGIAVAGLYLVRPLFAWPTTPLAVVVGYGFGISLGIPIALAGVVCTVIPVYVGARWAASSDSGGTETAADTGTVTDTNTDAETNTDTDTNTDADKNTWSTLPVAVGNALEGTGQTLTRYYETTGPIRGVTASRLAPIPSDITTCAAAISGVRLRHFLLGTVIGELPWTVAAVVVGASAATITADGLGELGLGLAAVCAVAGALLLAGPAYRLVRSRSRSNGDVSASNSS